MPRTEPLPLKRAFLYCLIASVVLSAVLGIVAILSGRFGWVEVRIILTTITIAVASISGLACGAYLATGRGRILPVSGVVLTLAAAAMIILGIWIEMDWELGWKLTAALSVFAVACAHLSLLSMARLAEWFEWSLVVAHVVIFGVAALIVLMIFAEMDTTGMFQLLGVAAIVDAAITILIPVFHRLSRPELAAAGGAAVVDHAAIDAEIARLKERIAELERKRDSGPG